MRSRAGGVSWNGTSGTMKEEPGLPESSAGLWAHMALPYFSANFLLDFVLTDSNYTASGFMSHRFCFREGRRACSRARGRDALESKTGSESG